MRESTASTPRPEPRGAERRRTPRLPVEGVLAGSLPWGLVGSGAAFAICAMIAGLPGLSFAVGVYLPLASLTPIFLGGCVRRLADARRSGWFPCATLYWLK